MATRTVCDATGEVLDGDFDVISELAERAYSAEAAVAVREYQRKRDELHQELADKWSWGLLQLREKWKSDYPDGKLPDEF